MAFKKGQPKIGGRPKGQTNHTTQKAKELIVLAIDAQSQHFDKVMSQIMVDEPKEWAKIMVKLMDFVLPKKIDLTSNDKGLTMPVIHWTEDANKPK